LRYEKLRRKPVDDLIDFYILNQDYTDISYINPKSTCFEIGDPCYNELHMACNIKHLPLVKQLVKHFKLDRNLIDYVVNGDQDKIDNVIYDICNNQI
jgi:hypothetical protein